MSIDRHLEKRGVQLSDDNSLPPGQRTQKVVKRVIAAVRAAEGEFNDELRDSNERCRVAQAQVIELQERCRVLESELRKHRVREEMAHMESLTMADQKRLIEVA